METYVSIVGLVAGLVFGGAPIVAASWIWVHKQIFGGGGAGLVAAGTAVLALTMAAYGDWSAFDDPAQPAVPGQTEVDIARLTTALDAAKAANQTLRDNLNKVTAARAAETGALHGSAPVASSDPRNPPPIGAKLIDPAAGGRNPPPIGAANSAPDAIVAPAAGRPNAAAAFIAGGAPPAQVAAPLGSAGPTQAVGAARASGAMPDPLSAFIAPGQATAPAVATPSAGGTNPHIAPDGKPNPLAGFIAQP